MNDLSEIFKSVIEALQFVDLSPTPAKGTLNFSEIKIPNTPADVTARFGIDENREVSLWMQSHEEVKGRKIFWQSSGIKASQHPSNTSGFASSVIVEADTTYSKDIFASLSHYIIQKYLLSKGHVKDTVESALNDWSDIFIKNAKGLNEQTHMGLIGELITLRDLASIHGPAALESWQGYEGERHDFRMGNNAIEVKVTTKPGLSVSINGVSQLSEPDDGKLVLRFIRLEKTPGGKITLPSMLNELSEVGISTPTIVDAILKLGGKLEDLTDETKSYTFIESIFYNVENGFPRISPSSFTGSSTPKGISNIKYTTDLTHASSFIITDTQSQTYLKEFIK